MTAVVPLLAEPYVGPVGPELYVGSAHALIAETLNLAITEHWREVGELQNHRALAVWHLRNPRESGSAALYDALYDELFSAGIETLAVALHARLQEQGTLT